MIYLAKFQNYSNIYRWKMILYPSSLLFMAKQSQALLRSEFSLGFKSVCFHHVNKTENSTPLSFYSKKLENDSFYIKLLIQFNSILLFMLSVYNSISLVKYKIFCIDQKSLRIVKDGAVISFSSFSSHRHS